MKKSRLRLLCLFLLAGILLSSCSSQIPVTTQDTEETQTTEKTETKEETVTSAPTQETKTEEVPTTPATPTKKIRNILMIGNSFCYYFADEMVGLAKADGQSITVGYLYKSGCRLYEHYDWMTNNTPDKYQFFVEKSPVHSQRTKTVITNFAGAVNYTDWDVISLQQHFDPSEAVEFNAAWNNANPTATPYVQKLYEYLDANSDADLYWHQTWAYQVGYKGAATTNNINNNFASVPAEKQVLDTAKQTLNYNIIKQVAQKICADFNVDIIPSGDAWQLARQNAVIGDTLCNDTGRAKDPAVCPSNQYGDNYHDGGVGGGQYLNACVWYEVLFQKSCVGNSFRPTEYKLDEAKVAALQQAAHEAVAAVYGENYAK